MAKKPLLPKRSKRFNVKTIQFVCGDCNAPMRRWKHPYETLKEHFWMKCTVCGMHIRVYEQTFHCIDINGRCYLETKWNMPLEKKKEFLQSEINYYENKKRMNEQYAELEKQMNEGLTQEKIDEIEKVKPINE